MITMSGVHSRLPALLADDEEVERYGHLLDSLGIGLIVFAPDTTVRHRNVIASEFCGNVVQSWQDIDGQPIASDKTPIAQVVRTSRPVFDRLLNLVPEGMSAIPVKANALPVFSTDGQVKLVLLILVKQTEDAPREFSIHDPLTGVFSENHAMFLLDNEIHRARRYGTPFTLALIAIDQQKPAEPSNAPAIDKQSMTVFGRLLAKAMRDIDVSGRFGSDEFLVILPNVVLNEAMIGLERLRLLVEAQAPPSFPVKITISGGATEYTGENSLPLIERCKSLLDLAKESGGNRFCVDLGII